MVWPNNSEPREHPLDWGDTQPVRYWIRKLPDFGMGVALGLIVVGGFIIAARVWPEDFEDFLNSLPSFKKT